ncbi:MAG: hypothetical protein K8T90_11345 [Planctomycetes bacterium]|nr:hypothetical protein [Planctomycetota bacterium]
MRHLLLVLAMLLAVPSFASAGDGDGEAGAAVLNDEDRRAFAWFDGLGIPSTAGKPRVVVSTGATWKDDDDSEQAQTVEGFLLCEDPDAYVVLGGDLVVARYPRRATERRKEATIEVLDLAARAAARLAELRKPPSDGPLEMEGNRFFSRFRARLGERAEVLAFARQCADHGLDAVAHELVGEARKLPNLRDSKIDPRPIEEVAADDIATSMIWRHTLDFGDVSIPRSKLLDEFRRFIVCFPRSEHVVSATNTVETLERMEREDAEHAKTAKLWDAMSKDERIAELIWRLRDAPGGQLSQPGRPYFFDKDAGGMPTALAQLVAMGLDAVPQLIPAIEDAQFTRCVGFWRDFMFSHYVQRVGDAALQALQEIAGQQFWQGKATAAAMVRDGDAVAVRKRVESWWSDYQTRGEKAVLIALVAEGEMNAAGALSRLAEKYPEAAAAAALKGLRAASGAARFNLLEAVRKVNDEGVTAYLVEQALVDPDLETRALAGRDALERGRLDVLPEMIRLWRSAAEGDLAGRSSSRRTLITSLVRCGSLDAIAALGERLSECAPAVAGDVAEDAGGQLPYLPRIDGFPAGAISAVEALVASLLDDARETGTTSMGKRTVHPRVCDEAAKQLAVVWKQPFVWDGDEEERDQQIAELRNVWRQRCGVPPLALPVPATVARVADAELRPLLDRLVASPGDIGAQEGVVNLGLGALPGIGEALDRLPQDHAARLSLTALAARVGAIVREARVADGSAPVPAPVIDALAALRARPLTSAALRDLFLGAMKSSAASARRVEVAADLRGGTGFVVSVRISNGDGSRTVGGDWTTNVRLTVGRADRYGPTGFVRIGGGVPQADDLRGLSAAIDDVLTALPAVAVAIRIVATTR